jgi:hypothetical protein
MLVLKYSIFQPKTRRHQMSIENTKTGRGTYVLIELLIFVQMFDFYIVTQSL